MAKQLESKAALVEELEKDKSAAFEQQRLTFAEVEAKVSCTLSVNYCPASIMNTVDL